MYEITFANQTVTKRDRAEACALARKFTVESKKACVIKNRARAETFVFEKGKLEEYDVDIAKLQSRPRRGGRNRDRKRPAA